MAKRYLAAVASAILIPRDARTPVTKESANEVFLHVFDPPRKS